MAPAYPRFVPKNLLRNKSFNAFVSFLADCVRRRSLLNETFFMTFCLLIRFRNIFIVNLAISGNVSSALFIFHFTMNCAIVRSLGIREISLISCERFTKSLPRAGGKLKPGTRKNDKTYIRPQASQFSVFHAGGKAAHNDFVN